MKVLCYQDTPKFCDVDYNLNTIERTAQAAKTLNADVIVFPELFVTGYNIGSEIVRLAQPMTGSTIESLKAFAKENAVAIITGLPEQQGDHIFNAAVAIDSSGEIVAHHRKVFLFGDKEKEIFMPGENFDVFELNGYRCGLSICYDIEFPESVRCIAKKGAEIIFNPTANMQPYTEVPFTLARARALENGVAMVYANLWGKEQGLHYTGLSAIISPKGTDLARAGEYPTILISDVSESIKMNRVDNISTQLSDLQASKFIAG